MGFDADRAEMRFAIEAVREAAKVTRRVQESFDVTGLEKDDKSPVTVADFASQAVVARALMDRFPDDPLVAEEDAAALRESQDVLDVVTRHVGEHRGELSADEVCAWIDRGNGEPADRFWALDPIDGTKGYLRKEQYAVALAMLEDGQVTLGVLGCPALGSGCSLDGGGGVIVAAQRGAGTYWAPLEGSGRFERLHVSDCSDVRHARLLRSVESGHTNVDQMGDLARSLGVEAEPVALDSQAKYAVLAAGGAEVLLRLLSPKRPDYREKIWDQAAGSIVVEEAGGRVTDLDGLPLDFTQGKTLAKNTGICATNGALHDRILKGLAELAPTG